jgi:hypothetical protein
MATGTQTQHQNERISAEAVFPLFLTAQIDPLSSANQAYLYIPVKCNLSQVYSVVETQLAGESTVTVKAPDGTVGTIVIATGSTVGTIDSIGTVDSDNVSIEAGEVLELENDATPTGGAASFLVKLVA